MSGQRIHVGAPTLSRTQLAGQCTGICFATSSARKVRQGKPYTGLLPRRQTSGQGAF
jgi:hypothetical protein